MESKTFATGEVKALPTDGADADGTVEAIVSVFGNVDEVGDIVEPGAFVDSLAQDLPFYVWSHEWGKVPIGTVLKAEERPEGLYIKARLFVAPGEDSQLAREVYTAMKAKDGNGKAALREFSFGYSVVDSEQKTVDGQDVRVLKKLNLFEVGPCLKGVNPATQLLAVKSALEVDQKAGRVLSKANEDALKQAADLINTVVEQVAAPKADTAPTEAKSTPTSAPIEAPENDVPADQTVAPDLTPAPAASQEDRARTVELLTANPNSPTPKKETTDV